MSKSEKFISDLPIDLDLTFKGRPLSVLIRPSVVFSVVPDNKDGLPVDLFRNTMQRSVYNDITGAKAKKAKPVENKEA